MGAEHAMSTRRFAEDTSVPVDRSQGEVKKRLREAGADQIAIFEAAEKSVVAFTLAGRQYRITIPLAPKAKNAAQEERRAWRLLLLLVKSKLEAIREGASTVEREFLADMVMPDKTTVHEWLQPQIAIAYERGAMPTQLMIEGPTHD
jgi:hypothetical protein